MNVLLRAGAPATSIQSTCSTCSASSGNASSRSSKNSVLMTALPPPGTMPDRWMTSYATYAMAPLKPPLLGRMATRSTSPLLRPENHASQLGACIGYEHLMPPSAVHDHDRRTARCPARSDLPDSPRRDAYGF